MEINFGAYSLPVVLTIILTFIFRFIGEDRIPKRVKPAVALVAGIGLGMAAVAYNAEPWTAKVIIDYGIYGIVQGAAAIGLWEVTTKTVMNK